MNWCSSGKDTKTLGIKTLLGEKKCGKLANIKKCLTFHRKYLQSVSRFATPSFVKKLKIIAVVFLRILEESEKSCKFVGKRIE